MRLLDACLGAVKQSRNFERKFSALKFIALKVLMASGTDALIFVVFP